MLPFFYSKNVKITLDIILNMRIMTFASQQNTLKQCVQDLWFRLFFADLAG